MDDTEQERGVEGRESCSVCDVILISVRIPLAVREGQEKAGEKTKKGGSFMVCIGLLLWR